MVTLRELESYSEPGGGHLSSLIKGLAVLLVVSILIVLVRTVLPEAEGGKHEILEKIVCSEYHDVKLSSELTVPICTGPVNPQDRLSRAIVAGNLDPCPKTFMRAAANRTSYVLVLAGRGIGPCAVAAAALAHSSAVHIYVFDPLPDSVSRLMSSEMAAGKKIVATLSARSASLGKAPLSGVHGGDVISLSGVVTDHVSVLAISCHFAVAALAGTVSASIDVVEFFAPMIVADQGPIALNQQEFHNAVESLLHNGFSVQHGPTDGPLKCADGFTLRRSQL